MKKPIAIREMEAFMKGGLIEFAEVRAREFNSLADKLRELILNHPSADWPYIAAAMRITADCLKTSLPDHAQRLTDELLEDMECMIYIEKSEGRDKDE